MLGTVLVATKVLAKKVGPRTAPITIIRPRPVTRLTSVQAATVAELRTALVETSTSPCDDPRISAHHRSRRRTTRSTTKAVPTNAVPAPIAAANSGPALTGAATGYEVNTRAGGRDGGSMVFPGPALGWRGSRR